MNDKLALKKELLEKCLEKQNEIVNTAKEEINYVQESAKGAKDGPEDEGDSFLETLQVTREMHARQLKEGLNHLAILNRINPNVVLDTVALGSVVQTDFLNYFISVSLGEIKIDSKSFMTISTQTPLFQTIIGMKKGDSFTFRGKKYKIKDLI